MTPVAPLDRLPPDRGVAALVGGEPVAVFRLTRPDGDDEVLAIDHADPATGAPVLARGLVGSTGDSDDLVLYVADPLHKQRFCLRTGRCLDDPRLAARVWPVSVIDGVVHVASEPVTAP